MLDMPVAKRSKVSTSIKTSGFCQTKEIVLECITNWLSLLNHNHTIDDTAPLLLQGVQDLYVDQLQQIMPGLSKLANTPALISQVLAGRPLDPAPFVHIANADVDLIQDIEICTLLGSLG
eukprot:15284132-Ditylum_brightwellii.AAC.1